MQKLIPFLVGLLVALTVEWVGASAASYQSCCPSCALAEHSDAAPSQAALCRQSTPTTSGKRLTHRVKRFVSLRCCLPLVVDANLGMRPSPKFWASSRPLNFRPYWFGSRWSKETVRKRLRDRRQLFGTCSSCRVGTRTGILAGGSERLLICMALLGTCTWSISRESDGKESSLPSPHSGCIR